jgi:choline dehydrogenase-like flavoprotein
VIIDGRAVAASVPSAFDVCVVGAGPAGLSIATRLADRGLLVGLVEAGGRWPTMRNQRMLVDHPSGSPYWDLQNVRVRMFGGSGSRWGGISRALDELDLAVRPWVEHSGWPLSWDDLVPYFEQAATLLDLPESVQNAKASPDLDEFRVAQYRLSPKVDFGSYYARRLRDNERIVVLLNTTVTGLGFTPDRSAVRSVEVRSFGKPARTLTARHVVIATGGIENARLLLASDVPNPHDVIGRYFMEHVHAPLARLVPSGELMGWTSYEMSTWPRLVRSLVPSDDVQKAEQLFTSSLALGPTWYVGEPPFVRRDYRLRVLAERIRRFSAVEAVVTHLPRLVRGFATKDVPTGSDDPTQLVVYRGEQPPRRENRVELSAHRDEFGRPLAHLHWTAAEPELANAERVLELFRKAVDTHGWGELGPLDPEWRTRIGGGPHHMGTTRMADEPKYGVVDADCTVHGVANLHVAGSSVFATGGHTNPTQTLVALSLRLADHLAGSAR